MTVTWIDFLGFSFAGAIIILMALGIVLSAIIPTLDEWIRFYGQFHDIEYRFGSDKGIDDIRRDQVFLIACQAVVLRSRRFDRFFIVCGNFIRIGQFHDGIERYSIKTVDKR